MTMLGTPPGKMQLTQLAQGCATADRNNSDAILHLWQYVTSIGVIGLVEAGWPDEASAQLFKDKVDVLSTRAQIYYGNAAQPDPYNFDDSLKGLRGPV